MPSRETLSVRDGSWQQQRGKENMTFLTIICPHTRKNNSNHPRRNNPLLRAYDSLEISGCASQNLTLICSPRRPVGVPATPPQKGGGQRSAANVLTALYSKILLRTASSAMVATLFPRTHVEGKRVRLGCLALPSLPRGRP